MEVQEQASETRVRKEACAFDAQLFMTFTIASRPEAIPEFGSPKLLA